MTRVTRRIVIAAIILTLGPYFQPERFTKAEPSEMTLRFDRLVPFKLGELVELQARVGTVKVLSVTFVSKTPEHGTSTVQAVFDCENPGPEEWFVDFTVDLIDGEGKTLRSAKRKWKFSVKVKEARLPFHMVPNELLPSIQQARIRMIAEMD